jgi:hypothetical protein
MSQLSPAATAPTALDAFPRVRILIYAIVLIAVAAFAHAENNGGLLLGALTAAAVAWLLVDHGRGRPVPSLLMNIIVLGATAHFFYQVRFGDSEDALINLGHFMIYIMLAKLFERKHARDITQILALALLVLVTGGIFATSGLFAGLTGLFVILSLYTLILFHIRTETQRAFTDRLLPSPAPINARGRLRAYRDVRRVTFACGLFLSTIGLAVFLLTPRSNGQPFLNWTPGATFESGYTSDVRLYQNGQLTLSDAVVMEVRLEQAGTNIGSEVYQPYFRGQALDSYSPDRHQWVRSMALNEDRANRMRDLDGTIPLGPEANNGAAQEVTQTYALEIFRDNLLFTLDDPLRIRSEQFRMVSFCSDDSSIMTQFNNRMPLQYTIASLALARSPRQGRTDNERPTTGPGSAGLDSPFVTPGTLGMYRRNFNAFREARVPPEIMTLAHDIVKDLLPPQGQQLPASSVRPIADRFMNYLQANYPYSLSFEAVNKDLDPTADFLINRKATGGHCEFFASAMVMLCRAVGVNARMVTGFHGGDFNTLGGFYIVRALHAHAWTEVCLPNVGWTRYDPSPASNDRAVSVDSYTRWIREFTQVLQQSWISNIISFDSTAQASLIASITAFFSSTGATISGWFSAAAAGFLQLFARHSQLAVPTRLGALLGLLLLATLLAVFLRRAWRRRTSPLRVASLRTLDRRSQRRLAHEIGFFDEFLRLLRKTGVSRTAGETPHEYVLGLRSRLSGAFEDAQFLVATFYDLRFGQLVLTPDLRSRVTAALQNVRASLHPDK